MSNDEKRYYRIANSVFDRSIPQICDRFLFACLDSDSAQKAIDTLNAQLPDQGKEWDFDALKAPMIGEFSVDFPLHCPDCYGQSEPTTNCEICGGFGEYKQPVNVPWTTIKDILKKASTLQQQPEQKLIDECFTGKETDEMEPTALANSGIKERKEAECEEAIDKLRWRSVEDELPELRTDVLVHTVGGCAVAFLDSYREWTIDHPVTTTYDMSSAIIDGEVTHWMPLPESPE